MAFNKKPFIITKETWLKKQYLRVDRQGPGKKGSEEIQEKLKGRIDQVEKWYQNWVQKAELWQVGGREAHPWLRCWFLVLWKSVAGQKCLLPVLAESLRTLCSLEEREPVVKKAAF